MTPAALLNPRPTVTESSPLSLQQVKVRAVYFLQMFTAGTKMPCFAKQHVA